MLRVAVIGLGPIGNRHARIYAEHPLAELVGVCERQPDRRAAASAALGVPGFESVETMLAQLAPDAVSVTTGGYEYSSDHYEPTLQAIAARCHVLGEKPICNEIPKAREMVAAAEAAGVCYGINLNHRFTEATLVAKRWQDEGRLGHLLFCNMAMWIGNPAESSPYYHLKALHPHTIDVMRHFCGDVEAVHCFATKAPGRQIWSTAQFNLKFVNGCVGSLTGSYDIARGHPMERCEVAGVKGRFVLDDMWREATLYPAGDPIRQVYANPVFGGHRDFEDTFRRRIDTWVRQVDGGAKPSEIDGSGREGLAAQLVIAAAIESLDGDCVARVQPL
jgi:predicted dehydrogenase